MQQSNRNKGYRFIPLPEEINRETRSYARLDRRESGTARIVLTVSYRVTKPVHIGSGRWYLNGNSPVRGITKSGDKPVIPGSTLKGLIRSRFEAITKSCCLHSSPRKRHLSAKLPSRGFPGYAVTFANSVTSHDVFSRACGKDSKLCAACALFGRISLRGRVSFRDLGCSSDIALEHLQLPERFSPRPHHLGKFVEHADKQTLEVTELHGRKIYTGALSIDSNEETTLAEVIPRGTELSADIYCTNITRAEYAGLLSALGIDPRSRLRVGSAKAYNFGELEPMDNLRCSTLEPDDLPDGFLESARHAFEQSNDRFSSGEDWLFTYSGIRHDT